MQALGNMQRFLNAVKIIILDETINTFSFFVQNIICGYTTVSTHNLCFRTKLRKICTPVKPQFKYIKVGYKGVYITYTCKHKMFISKIMFISKL